MKKIALIALNIPGHNAALATIKDLFAINNKFEITLFSKNNENIENTNLVKFDSIDNILLDLWNNYDTLIWFTSTGIVIRKLAPLLESKAKDPAIIVINLDRTQLIPLLSGHLGGANDLAQDLKTQITGLTIFITTATDSLEMFAFDLFAKRNGFDIVNLNKLAKISNSIINKSNVSVITFDSIKKLLQDEGLTNDNITFLNIEAMLKDFNYNNPSVLISPAITNIDQENSLCIRIKPVSIGIGLNKNTSFDELFNDFNSFIKTNNLYIENISAIASFEAKSDDKSLLKLSDRLKININFYNKEEINSLTNDFSYSEAEKIFSIKGVAEPTAILASQLKTLFVKKVVYKNTTFAAAF